MLFRSDDRCVSWEALQKEEPSNYVSVSPPPVLLPGWLPLEMAVSRTEALARVVKESLRNVTMDDLPRYVQPAYLQITQAERNLK